MDSNMDLDLDLDLDFLLNCSLAELKEIDANEKAVLEKEQTECRQIWERVEMARRQSSDVQEGLMETLVDLMFRSENDAMTVKSGQQTVDGIQTMLARLDECKKDCDRTVAESVKELDLMIPLNYVFEIHELEKQIENREAVYNNLLREQQLEKMHGERIRKQFLQKQTELKNEIRKCEMKLREMQFYSEIDNGGHRDDDDVGIDHDEKMPFARH